MPFAAPPKTDYTYYLVQNIMCFSVANLCGKALEFKYTLTDYFSVEHKLTRGYASVFNVEEGGITFVCETSENPDAKRKVGDDIHAAYKKVLSMPLTGLSLLKSNGSVLEKVFATKRLKGEKI